LAASRGTLDTVTIGSNLSVSPGSSLYINGNLTLANGVTLNSNNSGLALTGYGGLGGQHISTPGAAAINDINGNIIVMSQGLLIDSGITLQGSGILGQNRAGIPSSVPAEITNAGSIIPAQPALLLISMLPILRIAAHCKLPMDLRSIFLPLPSIIAEASPASAGSSVGIFPTGSLTNSGTIVSNGNVIGLGTLTNTWSNTGSITVNSGALNLGGALTDAGLAALNIQRASGTSLISQEPWTIRAALWTLAAEGFSVLED